MAEVIRVGVFFDGTGANKWNDEKINDGSITNIGKIYELYEQASKKSIEEGRKDFVEPLYSPGIGTLKYTKDNTFTDEQINVIREAADKEGNYLKKIDYYDTADMAIGAGAKDISDNMLEQIKDRIDKLQAENPNIQIVIDIHGFSRGAATARDFVNSVNEALSGDSHVRVGFVGLFDTVSSVGTKHDIYNGGLNLNLNSNSADEIVQFRASNERRLNFPLHSLEDKNGNLADNMKEIKVYGVHGDVGGGDPYFYKDNIIKDYGTKEFDRDNNVDKEYVLNSIEKTAEEKGFQAHTHIEETLSIVQYVYTAKVDRTNDLGRANLNIMLNEMEKHGISFPDRQNHDEDYSVSDDLKEYVEGVKNGEDISKYEDNVKGYISVSGGSITLQKDELRRGELITSFVNVNIDEREIFANKPEKAFLDEENFTLEDRIIESLNENGLSITKEEFVAFANSTEALKEIEDFKQELENQKNKELNINNNQEENTNVQLNLHR